jgi:hypothetical protein
LVASKAAQRTQVVVLMPARMTVGAQTAQQELEVGGVEGAVALLATYHPVAGVVQLGDDLGAGAAGQVMTQDTATGLARVVVGGLPERIGGDLGGLPILGDDVDDGYSALAQSGQERRRPLDDGAAALGGQGQRRHRGVEMAAMHVDRNRYGGAGIESEHGRCLRKELAQAPGEGNARARPSPAPR